VDFANFSKLPKKTELPEKVKLLDQRVFELMKRRKKNSCHVAKPHL